MRRFIVTPVTSKTAAALAVIGYETQDIVAQIAESIHWNLYTDVVCGWWRGTPLVHSWNETPAMW